MFLGKILGTVWATQKDPSLVGEKMQVVQPLSVHHKPVGRPLIALDSIGAGVGETVFYVTSSEATIPIKEQKKVKAVPTDATIVGIVDRIDVSNYQEL
ncbi:Ethanolamine utilization protein EutN/carboxysome structural protein Ccml [Chloroherpeton thalassium ATCC 35110]|uniref:Ethanolamine utilization protein EutN/carboxysome structural protein Ccml n=1 Tax=Chloroherpeton thalassium (strain ATCC 35110 / GB-78) TaxID=517418 RepID=B3QYA1_CHLT3|nr:EutN/CcmL family microcompartment protein [Chloroherpeton thalassium]ACF15067.1 Ethanolamine utilization protein EutN/carboxysome structural protein Ccml [Chloroherpeton thalassium ATCC 35110]